MLCMFVKVVMPMDGPVHIVEVVFFWYFRCFSHSLSMPILASLAPLMGPMGLAMG